MKIAVTLLALHLACALPFHTTAAQDSAATRGAAPRLAVRARGQRLVVVEGRRSHALDVRDKIDAARIEDATILFASRRRDFTYLLIDVCGWSKSKQDDRQCGAGEECNLLWLKLDGGWRVGDAKSVRYESCWQPVTSGDGYKVEGRVLRLAYSDLREKLEYKLTYDSDQPEKGFTVEESRLPDDAP